MTAPGAGLLAFLALAAPAPARPAAGARVVVEVLTRAAPRSLAVEGGGLVASFRARGDDLLRDGREVAVPHRLPARAWRVRPPGGAARSYRGALALRAERGLVRVRVEMDVEEYVAEVVASETEPGTPPEALAAQAVVARSYALAARDRHPGGALCDLAHCQVLRARGHRRAQRAASRAAARATAGEVLRLPSGEVALAPFHAACGGHTADPREAFGGEGTGAAAVPDDACPARPWRAGIDGGDLARAVRGALARSGDASEVPARLQAADLVLAEGRGGWISRVSARDGRVRLSGDAFARGVDGALGWGEVRSSRFAVSDEGGRVTFRGTGAGHGVGLCQAGAAVRAAAGQDHRTILRHYFPLAALGNSGGRRVTSAPPR
ncbi:MAG TPA: SpoIID/LytB domain-containing protein [Anaeromyxobacteraceae bacterium]|nr:SpoIID/LytB domain-containing protein [Anaeromyxobacteraceae bacterium]